MHTKENNTLVEKVLKEVQELKKVSILDMLEVRDLVLVLTYT